MAAIPPGSTTQSQAYGSDQPGTSMSAEYTRLTNLPHAGKSHHWQQGPSGDEPTWQPTRSGLGAPM